MDGLIPRKNATEHPLNAN